MSENDITYPWLGAVYDKQAGSWKWVTGEEFTYSGDFLEPEYASNPPDNHYISIEPPGKLKKMLLFVNGTK